MGSIASRPRALRGYVALSLVWLLILGGTLLLTRRPAPEPLPILLPPAATVTQTPRLTATPSPLRVDVAGAVRTPGVYRLPPGSIVLDAIAAAGGAGEDAALDRLNKAAALQDNMQLYVPRLTDPTAQPGTSSGANSSGQVVSGLINLNTASRDQLDDLPGIGPALADAIIAGRPYRDVIDLKRVKGIGDAVFAKIEALIAAP